MWLLETSGEEKEFGRSCMVFKKLDRSISVGDNRCFAVEAEPGDVVIVPPGWAHATISADPSRPLVFGAWCDRDYGFLYEGVRARGGLAWFPISDDSGGLGWEANSAYRRPSELTVKSPERYTQFGLEQAVPIYRQFGEDPDRFRFIPEPQQRAPEWQHFVP